MHPNTKIVATIGPASESPAILRKMILVAIGSDSKTVQDLSFSYGVEPVLERRPPASWPKYVKNWIRQHGLAGEFAILTKRPATGNHQMEILEFASHDSSSHNPIRPYRKTKKAL